MHFLTFKNISHEDKGSALTSSLVHSSICLTKLINIFHDSNHVLYNPRRSVLANTKPVFIQFFMTMVYMNFNNFDTYSKDLKTAVMNFLNKIPLNASV